MFHFFKSNKEYFKISLQEEEAIHLINSKSHLLLKEQKTEKAQFSDHSMSDNWYFPSYEINFSKEKDFLLVESYLFLPVAEYLAIFFSIVFLLLDMHSFY